VYDKLLKPRQSFLITLYLLHTHLESSKIILKKNIFTTIIEYKHVHVNLFCFYYSAFSLLVFERLQSFKHFPLVYVRYVHSLPLQQLNGSKKEIKRWTTFKILFIRN